MNPVELLSTEKDYVNKLTEQERKIYTADRQHLLSWYRFNDAAMNEFLGRALVLHALHAMHERLNVASESDLESSNGYMATDYEMQKFNMHLSIDFFGAVIDLNNMDDCSAVYEMLAQLKMSSFAWLLDNFDICQLQVSCDGCNGCTAHE